MEDFHPAADAYLEWAVATNFADVESLAPDRPAAGARQRKRLVGLIVAWKPDAKWAECWAEARAYGIFAAVYRNQRIGTIRMSQDQLPPFFAKLGDRLDAAELAMPISSDDGKADQSGGTTDVAPDENPAAVRGKQLLAVFDDGCAFGHPMLRGKNGQRLRWLWNQDADATGGVPLDSANGPTNTCTFRYGRQFSDGALQVLLDEHGPDPAAAYEAAGFTMLRRRAVHGVPVVEIASAGSDCDIVFVQFSRDAIDDPSGRWLSLAVLDGLHYAIAAAGPEVEHLVVCLSWGPQTGPHDGSSLLEQAIDELVDALSRRAAPSKPLTLDVCMPAGNSYGAQAHAQFDATHPGPLEWIVPPGGRTPSFVELWWPQGTLPEAVRLIVTPPGGSGIEIATRPVRHRLGWFSCLKKVGPGAMALLVVPPTAGARPSMHGRWTIEVQPRQRSQPLADAVHAYLARADHNMGARPRARAGRFEDEALRRSRCRPPKERFEEVDSSAIRRAGTLNGIATGEKTWVAAGYRLSDKSPSTYSSAGPTRGTRQAPSVAYPTDRSPVLAGLRVAGTRPGASVGIVGTSMAAPQLAAQQLAASGKVRRSLPATPSGDPYPSPDAMPFDRFGDGPRDARLPFRKQR